jgi:hypothetical protein
VPFKPNYRQQRSERNRSKQAKAEEKRAAIEQRVAARKAAGLDPEDPDQEQDPGREQESGPGQELAPEQGAAPEPEQEPAIGAFELSRIYADGWAAGKRSTGEEPPDVEAEALNPHHTTVERTRWAEGFVAARRRDSAG